MRKKEKSPDISTIVGPGTLVKGELTSTDGLRIDGKVMGKVKCNRAVIIGNKGEVEAEIVAQSVLIDGKVTGNVTAENLLEITRRGMLCGDIHTAKLITEPGAQFDGECKMASRNAPRDNNEPGELSEPSNFEVIRGKS